MTVMADIGYPHIDWLCMCCSLDKEVTVLDTLNDLEVA